MRIVQINQTFNWGSTGKIMYELNNVIEESKNDSFMVSAYASDDYSNNLLCINKNIFWSVRKDLMISRLTGENGYRYKKITNIILRWIASKKPDIIHLHNIHGDWLNLKMLFDFLKRSKIPVVWTLHDCWAFTGRCSHFELCKCNKWKTKCHDCSNKRVYPITYFFDKSSRMYLDKKEWFTSLDNMTIVTPSNWLAEYVKQSFLSKYPIRVIPNGINTEVFTQQKNISKYYKGLYGKFIILGVANSWDRMKGFDDFLNLDTIIDHDRYHIVMVGLNKKQLNNLPKTITGISKTNNQIELAELYSGANVYINLTYQDNYPTTNIEAQCCGIPCITYRTGGSPESINDPLNIIDQGDIAKVYKRIIEICNSPKSRISIENNKKFDKQNCFLHYINLYNDIYSHNEG